MSLKKIGILTALSTAAALVGGCTSTPQNPPEAKQAYISGTALFNERMALPPNATFEALLEDVSLADARSVVLGQQNISPAGNPPYTLRIPFNPAKLKPGHAYAVRASIRVNDQLWFTNDTSIRVLQSPSDTQVTVPMKLVRGSVQAPNPQPMPKPGSHASTDGGLLPAELRNHTWHVSHVDKQALSTGTRPTLRFDANEAKVSGNTSCNNYSASYSTHGQQLQFAAPMMTKMLCPASHEKAFVDALSRVHSWKQDAKILLLHDAAGAVLLTATRS